MKQLIVLVFALLLICTVNTQAQVIELLKDINPSYDSNPRILTEYNGKLYFIASDTLAYSSLWVTDGTAIGTSKIKDLQPSYPRAKAAFDFNTVIFKGKIFFIEALTNYSFGLWSSDGTPDGTKFLKEFFHQNFSDYNPYNLTIYNDELYFLADNIVNDTLVRGIWTSDGSKSGTKLLKKIQPTTALITFNNKLVFGDASQLWASDGTLAGTQMVRDSVFFLYTNNPIVVFKDKCYFFATDEINKTGPILMSWDGVSKNTEVVLNSDNGRMFSYGAILAQDNDRLYFGGDNQGKFLAYTDGTQNGTHDIKQTNDNFVHSGLILNSILYYSSGSYNLNGNLWRSDGSDTGTYKLNKFSVPYQTIAAVGNRVYFASDSGDGNELWTTDGTINGTYKLPSSEFNDHTKGPLGVNPIIYKFGNSLYFPADYGQTGVELWRVRDTSKASVNEQLLNNKNIITSQITHDKLHLNFTQPTTITITDILGATISKRMVQATDDIDVSTLSNGTYFIHSDDNTFSTKFLKY